MLRDAGSYSLNSSKRLDVIEELLQDDGQDVFGLAIVRQGVHLAELIRRGTRLRSDDESMCDPCVCVCVSLCLLRSCDLLHASL